jgi:RES domain
MNSIVCSHCFKKHSLKMMAENSGFASNDPCPRCMSSKGKRLSQDDFIWLMTSYFENGSIDLSVGNHQPKYRLRETNEKAYETLALDADLMQDCKMFHELTGYSVDLNYSRLANMGVWGFNGDLNDITSQDPCNESFDKLDKLLSTAISKFKAETIPPGTIIYRIKKNLPHDIDTDTATVFDSPKHNSRPDEFSFHDRFSASTIPVFYGAFDISTCLFECRIDYLEELTLGTFKLAKSLKLLNLEDFEETVTGLEREDLGCFVSRMLYKREYELNSYFSVMAFRLGFQGIKYCSYFSKVRGNRHMNVALFGSPIAKGQIQPLSFDRVTINNVEVNFSLGPVFQKEKEKQLIRRIMSRSQNSGENEIQTKAIEGKPSNEDESESKINIHSLATIKKIYRRT